MAVAALLLGVVTLLLWVFTVGASVYVWWRYVKVPWNVMRKDVIALTEKFQAYEARLDAVDEFTRSARVQGLTDEEAALRERRYRMKRAAAIIGAP